MASVQEKLSNSEVIIPEDNSEEEISVIEISPIALRKEKIVC